MTYQGERARPMASENARFFAVSKVRIGLDGYISDVLWSEINPGLDRAVGPSVEATAAEVVDAIHDGAQVSAVFPAMERSPERSFVVTMHQNGRECIVLDGVLSQGRNITDLDRLDQ